MYQNQYFKTQSFYLALFLFVKGCELIEVEKSISIKKNFVFIDSPKLHELVEIFNFSKENDKKIMVDIRKVATAIKRLKDLLYQ